jgi:hypothetical protein
VKLSDWEVTSSYSDDPGPLGNSRLLDSEVPGRLLFLAVFVYEERLIFR